MIRMLYSLFLLFLPIFCFSQKWSPQTNDNKVPDDVHWDYRFDSTNSPNGPVHAIFVKDTNVYIGGQFTMVGNVPANNIARWNGHQWFALADGVNSGVGTPCVITITVDDNNNVYTGGRFDSAGLVASANIAQWNGTGWQSFGTGANDEVRTLALSPEGDLYVGGLFSLIDGTSANFIARWNGASWNNLSGGVSGAGLSTCVNTIATDISGVYAGGEFNMAGTDSANNIALWNGISWTALGSGTNAKVNSLASNGSTLYAGGDFTTAGGVSVNHFAKYSGNWSDVPAGLDYSPTAVGIGPYDQYATSSISSVGANHITKYDCCWDPLGSGLDSTALALFVNGKDVWVGGNFHHAGEKESFHLAHWNYFVSFIGIEEPTEETLILVFPNPGNNEFSISGLTSRFTTLSLYNLLGELILSLPISIGSSDNFRFTTGTLPQSIYLVRCSGPSEFVQTKIVVE